MVPLEPKSESRHRTRANTIQIDDGTVDPQEKPEMPQTRAVLSRNHLGQSKSYGVDQTAPKKLVQQEERVQAKAPPNLARLAVGKSRKSGSSITVGSTS